MVKVIHTSGKRKTAIARGTVQEGTGKVRINRIPLELYSPELANLKLQEPLTLAGDLANEVDINIKVVGGGVMGQAEAARMVIAKGLVQWSQDMDLKEKFIQYDIPVFYVNDLPVDYFLSVFSSSFNSGR